MTTSSPRLPEQTNGVPDAFQGSRARPAFYAHVYGHPTTQGSKDFVGTKKVRDPVTGKVRNKGIMIESSKENGKWRATVSWEVHQAALRGAREGRWSSPWQTLDEAVVVGMVFTLRKPQRLPKGQLWPANARYDVSKLARSVEDALTEGTIWRDDGLIVEYDRLAKVYPSSDRDALDRPGVVIAVWRAVDYFSPLPEIS